MPSKIENPPPTRSSSPPVSSAPAAKSGRQSRPRTRIKTSIEVRPAVPSLDDGASEHASVEDYLSLEPGTIARLEREPHPPASASASSPASSFASSSASSFGSWEPVDRPASISIAAGGARIETFNFSDRVVDRLFGCWHRWGWPISMRSIRCSARGIALADYPDGFDSHQACSRCGAERLYSTRAMAPGPLFRRVGLPVL